MSFMPIKGKIDSRNVLLLKNIRCHCFVDRKNMFASKGYQLFTVHLDTLSLMENADLRKISLTKISRFGLFNRLLRKGIHQVVGISKSKAVIMMDQYIVVINERAKDVNILHRRGRGSRPLNCCLTNDHHVYWGEYFGNENRKQVRIFRLGLDETSCDVAYRFPPGSIRHVHGVFYDQYEQKIWVTTGDNDNESGIWVTHDRFRTLEMILGGRQQLRTIQLLFKEDYVYFGSDTPLERNFIYRLERVSGRVEKLQEVGNSVFWGCKVGDYLFFSTAVEPSKVNKCRDSCIWGSKDGENWQCIARFRKDIWPMKLFQYGQIFFPSGENNTDYLWFTPFATEKHMTIQRINVREIF